MEQAITNILKVDWNKAQAELDELKEWQEKLDARAWQIWFVVIVALLTSALGLILK
jgi:hypothetical protein